ncbi:MAG: DNA methylase, partial [Oscillospiraceae bacterium]|nr:DNA methylase [Oscillospiraceae bacterium]
MPVYAAIDLKSFYASAECVDLGKNPLNTNLVVADLTRTEKTICLAVSPSLKAIGVPGRPRLFEVVQKVAQENERRRCRAPGRRFSGESCLADELQWDPSLELGYIVAPPRMRRYMEISTAIY